MSGFFRPAAAKMSTTSSDDHGLRDDLADGVVEVLVGLAARRASLLASTARTAWKKPTSSRMRSASSCGTASANACESSRHGAAAAAPCRPPGARMCSCAAGSSDSRSCGVPVDPGRPVEAVEQAAADLVLLEHHGDGLVLVDRGLAGAAALGVGRQRLLQLVGEAEVVDDQAAGLVLEHAVDARDRLHQPVAAHRLVDVHRVQARGVEAGQPHVAHDHELERVRRGRGSAWPAPRGAACCGCAAASRAGRTRSRSSRP